MDDVYYKDGVCVISYLAGDYPLAAALWNSLGGEEFNNGALMDVY